MTWEFTLLPMFILGLALLCVNTISLFRSIPVANTFINHTNQPLTCGDYMPSYSEIVIGASEKAGDSVVNISIVRMAQDSFFNTVPLQGMGSGIIMDEGNGTILTNNHIVAGAQRVAVTLNSGKRFSGTIVGAD